MDAEVLYAIRAPKLSQAKELRARVEKIAQGAALMTGTKVTSTIKAVCSNYIGNEVIGKVLQKNLLHYAVKEYSKEINCY